MNNTYQNMEIRDTPESNDNGTELNNFSNKTKIAMIAGVTH